MHEFWSYCGEIESMDLMRFPDSGRFKGIAFITFATVCYPSCATAKAVIHDIDGFLVGNIKREGRERERNLHLVQMKRGRGYMCHCRCEIHDFDLYPQGKMKKREGREIVYD